MVDGYGGGNYLFCTNTLYHHRLQLIAVYGLPLSRWSSPDERIVVTDSTADHWPFSILDSSWWHSWLSPKETRTSQCRRRTHKRRCTFHFLFSPGFFIVQTIPDGLCNRQQEDRKYQAETPEEQPEGTVPKLRVNMAKSHCFIRKNAV